MEARCVGSACVWCVLFDPLLKFDTHRRILAFAGILQEAKVLQVIPTAYSPSWECECAYRIG